MSELMVFNNPEFGEIRSVEIDGEPWLVGKDVAAALGYSNPQKAIRDHVDEEDITVNAAFTVNGTQGTLINESGCYSLILSSKLPDAKKFKRWVTSEVLPSIRKTGGYLAPAAAKNIEDLVAAVQLLTEQVETLVNRESGTAAALAVPELETSAYWKVPQQVDGPAARKRWMRTVSEKLELLAVRLRSSSRSVLYQIYHVLESEHKVSLDEERIRVIEEYRLDDCSILASIFYNETLKDAFQRVVDHNLAPENRGW